MNRIGYIYDNGGPGVEKNSKTVFVWFERGSLGGDAYAQFNIAMCFYDGVGATKDYIQLQEIKSQKEHQFWILPSDS